MRARLIHNPSAGAGCHAADDLIAALERAGFEVACERRFRKKRIAKWLEQPADVAVAAGGDGTIIATVRALMGRSVPLAIARLGTANNIAASLGLDAPVADALEGLRDPVRRRLDVGIAGGAWGERLFVEGVGVGLFQHVLQHEASSEDKHPDRALRILLEAARHYPPCAWQVTIDGEDRSGEYTLIEAMNVRSIGPGVQLAPIADAFDGLLDVVLLTERERPALTRYLEALLAKDPGARLDAPMTRARHLHVRLAGASARLDDEILPGPREPASEHLDVRLLPGAIELWLPRPMAVPTRPRHEDALRASP